MAGLTPQHYKILTLLEEDASLSNKEIADAVGFSEEYVRQLMYGHHSTGPMGQLFQTALNKTYKKISKNIRKRSKSTQDILIKKLEKWAKKIPADKMNEKHVKKACEILHALSKAVPKVEIGHLSIVNHMSSEELFNEFKRVKTLSRFALDGIGVPSTSKGRTREIHRALASGDNVAEESETDVLSPESEAGDVSQE